MDIGHQDKKTHTNTNKLQRFSKKKLALKERSFPNLQ